MIAHVAIAADLVRIRHAELLAEADAERLARAARAHSDKASILARIVARLRAILASAAAHVEVEEAR